MGAERTRLDIHVLPEPLIGYRVLGREQNVSAPAAAVIRRTTWEHTRVREQYRHMDDETLHRAFGADIPPDVAARGLPMPIQLALRAAGLAEPQFHLFALETLQGTVRRRVPGVTPADLDDVAGRVDPLRLLAFEAQRSTLGMVTKQRDEARVQLEGVAGYVETSIATLQQQEGGSVTESISQAVAAFRAKGS